MKSLGRGRGLVVSAAAVLGLGAMASAATQTYNFGPIGGTAGAAGSFNVPQFDDLGGTLTLLSVQVILDGESNGGSNSADNESENAGTATLTIGSDITVTGPASLLVLTQPNNSDSGPITADNDGAPDFTGSDSFAVSGVLSTDSDSDTLTSPPDNLSPYIGLGNVTFNYASAANSTSNINVSPAVTFSTPPSFSFDGQVIYTYEVVPEPASVGLLALGGAMMLRRRR